MSNLNTAIRFDPQAEKQGPYSKGNFHDQDNAAFLAHVASDLNDLAKKKPATEKKAGFTPGGVACIGLMGEYGLIGYGIRRAQESIRTDRGPSLWSHAFLFSEPVSTDAQKNRGRESPVIWESTLEPALGMNNPLWRNGVGPRNIGDYAFAGFDPFNPHCVPNMAVIAIALTTGERQAILDRAREPNVDQLTYDIPGVLGTWFAFLMSRGDRPNPLASGASIYCSAYLQLAYDAAGIDLAPGAHQRNTAPEHLWQTATYLYEQNRRPSNAKGKREVRAIHYWAVVRDPACLIMPLADDSSDKPSSAPMRALALEDAGGNARAAARSARSIFDLRPANRV